MLTIWIIGLLACLCGGINGFTKEEWQRQVDETFRETNKDVGNLGKYGEDSLTFHTETTVYLPPGYPAVIGKEELREYSKNTQYAWEMYIVETTRDDVIAYTNEVVVVNMKFTFTKRDGGGRRMVKNVALMKKVDGEAKEDMMIWNFDS